MTQIHERRIARDPFTGVQIRIGVMGFSGRRIRWFCDGSLPEARTRDW